MDRQKIFYLSGDIFHNKYPNHRIYYFDNNSTTLIYDDDVKSAIMSWISCGNPSNILHDFGISAHSMMDICRHTIAKHIKVIPSEMYFTSGATESNNIIIQGIFRFCKENFKDNKFTIITSSFEHPSVHNIFKHYDADEQFNIIYINPSDNKTVTPESVENAIKTAKHKVIMISIMHANNETGAIQDISSIGKIARKHDIFFHSDCTQSMGKYKILPHVMHIDAFSFSAHKFHGPKGVGGLYISHKYKDKFHLCYGGEQENHLRPGTENISNIVGMTYALKKVHTDREEKNKKLADMKNFIISELQKELDIEVLGPNNNCLPNTLLILFRDIGKCNKILVKDLNKLYICVSVGSACQTSQKSSHVLDAINVQEKDKKKIIRISLSDYNTKEECEYLIESLIKCIKNKKI